MKNNTYNENIMYLSALNDTNSPGKFIVGKKYTMFFKTALHSWGSCGVKSLSYLVEDIVETLFVNVVNVILSYLVEDIVEPWG